MYEYFSFFVSYKSNQEYTLSAITRHKSRLKFQEKIGKLLYALGKYERLIRAMVPINDYYYLLITFDIEESNFDSILLEKVIPLVTKEEEGIRPKK